MVAIYLAGNARPRGNLSQWSPRLVWMLLQKMPLGYDLIVTGFNPSPRATRASMSRGDVVLAAFFAGGLVVSPDSWKFSDRSTG